MLAGGDDTNRDSVCRFQLAALFLTPFAAQMPERLEKSSRSLCRFLRQHQPKAADTEETLVRRARDVNHSNH